MIFRRNIKIHLFHLAILILAGCSVGPPESGTTALAIIGDRYHNSDYIRTALSKTLVRDAGITIDFTDDVNRINMENLKNYRILILFRDGMIWPGGYGEDFWYPGYDTRDTNSMPFRISPSSWVEGYSRMNPIPVTSDPPLDPYDVITEYWMTDEQAIAIRDFIEAGGGALFYHNCNYISSENEIFRKTIRAVTEGHPPIRPFRVRNVNPTHPIMKDVRDFTVTDEQHFVSYEGDPADVLMRSVNEAGLNYKDLGNSCEAGWAFELGNGRVCYLAPGHMITALWNPEYEKVQKNAIKWLLKEN